MLMPAYCSALCRQVYRLPNVESLNGVPVVEEERTAAAAMFGHLGRVALGRGVQGPVERATRSNTQSMSIPSLEICRSTLRTDPFRV